MAQTYQQIQQQIEALQAEASRLRAEEVASVVAQINAQIAQYGLTAADLSFPRGATGRKGRGTRAAAATSGAQYADGQGNTWGGRGPRPRWLREALSSGHELSEFLVGAAAPAAPAPAKAARPAAKKAAAKKAGRTKG